MNHVEVTHKDFFFCYSINLKQFLLDNGARYLVKAKHDVTGKKFWMFQRTEFANELLAKWNDGFHEIYENK